MVEALVEHDYVAKEPNELTISKGDIVKDVIKKQSGWLEGTLKDKKGMFPDTYVKVMEKEPTVVLRNRRDATRIRQCRVVFSYKQDHEDELNLNVGDVIEILGEEEEGWWRGFLNGKEGVFPSNFVEEITVVAPKGKGSRENLTEVSNDTTTPLLPAKPAKILCEVKFAYKAQNDDELSLKEGDIVTLISKDSQDPGWWKGDLNGTMGVFPDNFVTVLPLGEDEAARDDRRAKSFAAPNPIKPSTITSQQRRSLDTQMNDKDSTTDIGGSKTTPPVPGKKPTIPVKKSPSGSGAAAGIFFGLKKKLVDVVDGASGSKSTPPPKTELTGDEASDNAFDDVVRRPLLGDVRASRPKAPGRRLPSAVFKEAEPGIVNGNTDHTVVDALTNPPVLANVSSSPEVDGVDGKPKLREWEKHRAPWLEEMKLNQAKRTSTSPGPEQKLKLTPTDKSTIETEDPKPIKPFEKESSPIEVPRPMSSYNARIKTPPNELEKSVIKNKSNVPMPSRPQTIHNINANDTNLTKPIAPLIPKVSPLANKTPSPVPPKTTVEHKSTVDSNGVDHKTYLELVERVNKLEELLRKSNLAHTVAIEQLTGKLQVETEMRMELQAKFENFLTESTSIQQL